MATPTNARLPSKKLMLALAVYAGVALARLGIHGAIYKDVPALFEIAVLDVAAALMAALAFVTGPFVGESFGSLTITALVLGLPLVGMGALGEWVRGAHYSKLVGLAGLLGMGVGWCAAIVARRALVIFGAIAVGLGAYWLVSIQQAREAILIAMPAMAAAITLTIVGFLPRRDSTR